MSYTTPPKDMLFDIEHPTNIGEIAMLPGIEEQACARFNQNVVVPLNIEGDRNPSPFKGGAVTTTPGVKGAFAQDVSGGRQGLQHAADFGGQGLPKTIGAAGGEMVNSANMSFALCPLLSDGAIEALLTAGSHDLNAVYLAKLVSRQWTDTMHFTEPQPDDTYKVFDTKIFITDGEHKMAENVVQAWRQRETLISSADNLAH